MATRLSKAEWQILNDYRERFGKMSFEYAVTLAIKAAQFHKDCRVTLSGGTKLDWAEKADAYFHYAELLEKEELSLRVK